MSLVEGQHETVAPVHLSDPQSAAQMSDMRKLSADLKNSEVDTVDAASTQAGDSRNVSKARGSVASVDSVDAKNTTLGRPSGAAFEDEVEDEEVSEDEEDVSPTYRHGMMGDHYQVPGQMCRASSRVTPTGTDEPAYHWKTKGAMNEWAIYDFGEKVCLTEINFRFFGNSILPLTNGVNLNPSSVTIYQNMNNDINGDFVIVKRMFVPEKSKKLHVAWRQDEGARFWKVEFHSNHEVDVRGNVDSAICVQNIQFIAEDTDTRKKTQGLKLMSKEHSAQLGRLTTMFDESTLLNEEQIEVRNLARACGIALTDAEKLRQKFDKYDTDGSGLIDKEEFGEILRELMMVKSKSDVPQERFDFYWREIDNDQSGEVDFGEFLTWYQNIVKTNALNPEAFYATFGVKRLSRQADTMPTVEEIAAAAGGKKEEEKK